MPDRQAGTPLLPPAGTVIAQTFKRELLLAFRSGSDLANPLLFFFSVLIFIPLGVSPDPKVLAGIAPGMIWIVALLATLLSLDRLFASDYDDGALEQMLVSGQPLYWLVMVKIVVHWMVTGLPLTVLSPVLGVLMALPPEGFATLCLSLLVGTFVLSAIGAIGAALTVCLRRGGLLLSLIIMPMYVPVLVFGTGAVRAAVDGVAAGGHLAVLGAMLALALALAPVAASGAIRVTTRN